MILGLTPGETVIKSGGRVVTCKPGSFSESWIEGHRWLISRGKLALVAAHSQRLSCTQIYLPCLIYQDDNFSRRVLTFYIYAVNTGLTFQVILESESP